MARSPYWPHPTYLDTSIVFTILITGCHASADSDEMAGFIAGSIFACIIFVAAVVAIVYCIVKDQRSRKANKHGIMKASQSFDSRTVVVRKVPSGENDHRSVVGYLDYMIGYQPPIQNTLSHMPVQGPALVETFNSASLPRKSHRSSREKSIERKSKRKSKSRSKKSIPNLIIPDMEINSGDNDGWPGRQSQFILQEKSESGLESGLTAKTNEPYMLTSLFSRDRESTQKYDFYPEKEKPKEEMKTGRVSTSASTDLPIYATPQPVQEQESASLMLYPPKINSPKRTNSEVKESSKPRRSGHLGSEISLIPDYDLESVMDEEVPRAKAPVTNKFSYAFAEELKQNSRFLANSNSTSKQVQFNQSSSDTTLTSLQTNHLTPGTYGYIPPPPPLPPS